jgi:hypothetical protein
MPGAVQDADLKRELEAARMRLNGLDVEDLDAEHEALALTEHVLEKLNGPASAAELPSSAAADAPPQQAQQAQAGGGADKQQPVALLGPP